MFRIVWTSLLNGNKGHGEAVFTQEQAIEMAKSWNKGCPECNHTIEKYEPALSLNVKGHRCSYGDLTFVGHPTPSASTEPSPIASSQPLASQPLAEVSQQQSSPPPSGFSTSFF
jgi:hypothetical protein